MSELDVIVIHIRAEQAAEYERLFAERELPRWREYKARGAFISARISRAAFGTDQRLDVAKYVIAACPGTFRRSPGRREMHMPRCAPGCNVRAHLARACHGRPVDGSFPPAPPGTPGRAGRAGPEAGSPRAWSM